MRDIPNMTSVGHCTDMAVQGINSGPFQEQVLLTAEQSPHPC